MSRDFTPREMLGFEAYVMKQGGGNLFEQMKGTSYTFNGATRPLHSAEEMAIREQYPALGKLYRLFPALYKSLSRISGGLDLLKQRDNELSVYVSNGTGREDSYLIKWFNGELDEGFYSDERNNSLFAEAILTDARTISLAYPRRASFPGDSFDITTIATDRLTERSNARLCFDVFDGKEHVCVDLCYDNRESLPACDVTCVYSAPVSTEALDEARDALYQICEKFNIPGFDVDDAALIQYPVRVALVYLGEGIRGDYDSKDPNDIPLLRFDVSVCRDGIWEEKEDGSYCTCLPLDASKGAQEHALSQLMNAFYPILSKDVEASIKKVGERMSHIGVDYSEPIKPSLDTQIKNAAPRTGNTHIVPNYNELGR